MTLLLVSQVPLKKVYSCNLPAVIGALVVLALGQAGAVDIDVLGLDDGAAGIIEVLFRTLSADHHGNSIVLRAHTLSVESWEKIPPGMRTM